ncbi:DoxX family protein [Myxococcota bacterium]|nr:DoxX family protein [Myxococcota bacterium]
MNNAATLPAISTSSKGLHLGLWAAQVLLAAAFLMAGGMKVSAPLEELAAQMPWVTGALGGAVRFIGVMELLGALGLVLPAATRIMPKLTPLAASGLLTVMALAAMTHLVRGEHPMLVANFVLAGLAAFVAWGRFVKAPITARGE